MDVFALRDGLVGDYEEYSRSFLTIRDSRVEAVVEERLRDGLLWPEPMIQLNPSFEPGAWIEDLVGEGVLHDACSRIFRKNKQPGPTETGEPLRLHHHQDAAIRAARTGENYVLTTGTGSGKSLAYIVPIVDMVLRGGGGTGIKAIVVYPMNALANSQLGELEKFIGHGFPDGKGPVTFRRYTGQESQPEREAIRSNPPDILLTNYVMLELLLTRREDRPVVEAAQGLRFIVLDELHTYRGRQGADVAMLVRRVRDLCGGDGLQCVGTSATVAGAGTFAAQQEEVARVAAQLFGDPVKAAAVIGETLRRSTAEPDLADPEFQSALAARVVAGSDPPVDYDGFVADPLARWIESAFGIQADPETQRLVRRTPRPVTGADGAVRELADLVGGDETAATEAIKATLLAGYRATNPDTGFPVFAFRLHQFISKGDTVYASPEPAPARHVTTEAQTYVPGSERGRVLLPLAFCRECGQDYYVIRRVAGDDGRAAFVPRDLGDRVSDDEGTAGFLYTSEDRPWPEHLDQEALERLPEDWVDDDGTGTLTLAKGRNKNVPEALPVGPDGTVGAGADFAFVKAPLRFCLCCGATWGSRQASDFGKLSTLGSEGRSTATTLLSLAAVRRLREDKALSERARKLLSFTDNRQDAALQAGHFNDFVQVGLIRAALTKAVADAGPAGLTHDVLAQKAFDAIDLPVELYAADPDVQFAARANTERALRNVLEYRLYVDLRRGWRVTAPNLEQCGLLRIDYESLDELARHDAIWVQDDRGSPCPPPLAGADPATRARIARVLLDHLRRELAVRVDCLDRNYQESLQRQSSQALRDPWSLGFDEQLEYAPVLYPRPRRPNDHRGNLYLSARSTFGQFLRRANTFPAHVARLTLADTEAVIAYLFDALRVAGLVEVVAPPRDENDVPGYQVHAGAMLWLAGDGTPAWDPLRMPRLPESGSQPNAFFVAYYGEIAGETRGMQAREHTAQVTAAERLDREEAFREGRLPVLYCSPTMELGVDIAELNAVNMRNVPPTPANYAQRSGRAGRSGQPALVFTYCTTGSPHDQWFFRRPHAMVSGQVTPPRIDLSNEDLVRSHVHSIWLRETGAQLGRSLKEVLDLDGETPTLELRDRLRADVADPGAAERARARAGPLLDTIAPDLGDAEWWSGHWLQEVLDQAPTRLDGACVRWRDLWRSATAQRDAANRVIGDASRDSKEKDAARRLRAQAEAQLDLLTADDENLMQSDFYSYRYFASEGFLPGYNFPRLPLSAFIPGRRGPGSRDDFVSRPRFLAISEFGPRATIYHDGSRYQINRVIMPVDGGEGTGLVKRSAKLCGVCGYLHAVVGTAGRDRCEFCDAELEGAMDQLFRLQNVQTRRRDRITSDEEERLRLGFDLRTAVRFADIGGRRAERQATVADAGGATIATLHYGHAADLWRINLGWRRRKNKEVLGFALDVDRGYWESDAELTGDDTPESMGKNVERVVPYVEDRRNCLILAPSEALPAAAAASLEAALKNALQVVFQLEDSELATEPLPSPEDRRRILLYEAAEGGAGVLRRLVDDPTALARVARAALELCHFDPDTGADEHGAPGAREGCEAACYDCLMSYGNQRDHRLLDRHAALDVLKSLAGATVAPSPAAASRPEHLQRLRTTAGSDLELELLDRLETRNLRLPDRAQTRLDAYSTTPDFLYEEPFQVAVYVDGPVHDDADRAHADTRIRDALEDAGWTVLRFRYDEDWDEVIARYPEIFGTGS